MKTVAAVIVCAVFVALSAAVSYAVPDLQLYIPGSNYVGTDSDPWVNESWFTENSTFELWVIVANSDVKDLNIVFAVPECQEGSITISSKTAGFLGGYYDNFITGTPAIGNKKNGDLVYMPAHGVFPACYATHYIGDVSVGDDIVDDMVDGEGSKTGKIIKFDFSKTGFDKVHFDVFGYNGPVAPFSHDAEDGPLENKCTPEPGTMALVGLGIAGIVGLRKKRVRL